MILDDIWMYIILIIIVAVIVYIVWMWIKTYNKFQYWYERTKEAFYTDEQGIKRSIKTNKAVGKSGKDKASTVRNKSSYYQDWIKRKSMNKGEL